MKLDRKKIILKSADKFIKQQIQNKLMTAEEKMPKLKDLLGDI